MIYEKIGQKIAVNDKFIYCISVYKLWSNGASIIDEKFYTSTKFITFKKNILDKKSYKIIRFIELTHAPENYLINNNYKLLEE